MIYKLLNIILAFITRRLVFMTLILGTFVFSIYCLKGLFNFMHFFETMPPNDIEDMSETLNGIAGTLVAMGVLLEERETMLKMGKLKERPVDVYLNEVAHHNGLGLLLIGLFMEIVTLLIGSPKTIVNTIGIEIYLFVFCFLLVVLSMIVEIDFLKDYTKSYFKKDFSTEH
jgi:hypothetical protein